MPSPGFGRDHAGALDPGRPAAVISAVQMIAGKPAPVFPRRIATCLLFLRDASASVVQRAILDAWISSSRSFIHWHTSPEATKRLVGAAVVLLSATLMFIPIPLSNVVPALVIALISLAYIEGDGLLLLVALLAAIVLLVVATAALWEMFTGAKSILDLWQ